MADTTNTTQEKKDLVLQVYKTKAGNVSEICAAINIDRTTFYRWQKEDEKFKQAVHDEAEALIDFAESKLFKLIDDKVPSAIFFFLKCKAKHRGYVEKQEIEHSGEITPLKVIVSDNGQK